MAEIKEQIRIWSKTENVLKIRLKMYPPILLYIIQERVVCILQIC